MQYHVAVSGEQKGPFTLDEVRGLVKAGSVTPDSMAWTEGLAAWAPAREVFASTDLFSAMPAHPPALPAAGADIETEWTTFLGQKRKERYLGRFRAIHAGDRVHWHWAAAFFNSTWMLFRKMWLWALVGYPLCVVLIYIPIFAIGGDSPATDGVARLVSNLASFVLLGLYADTLYYRHAMKKIAKSRERAASQGWSEQARLAWLAKAGGTSSIIIWILVSVCVLGILAAIAIPAYQDYIARAQLAEGVQMLKDCEGQLASSRQRTGAWPDSLESAGCVQSGRYGGLHYAPDDPSSESLQLWYLHNEVGVAKAVSGKTLVGYTRDGGARWQCSASNIRAALVPAQCKD